PAEFVGVESDEGPESGRILRILRQAPLVRLDRLALPIEPDQAGSPAVQGDRVPGVEAKRLLVDREGCVVGARRHERSRFRGETPGGLGLPDDGTRSGFWRLD